MGEIVYLDEVRASKRTMARFEEEEADCREKRSVNACAECPEIGECDIHQRMLAFEVGELDDE